MSFLLKCNNKYIWKCFVRTPVTERSPAQGLKQRTFKRKKLWQLGSVDITPEYKEHHGQDKSHINLYGKSYVPNLFAIFVLNEKSQLSVSPIQDELDKIPLQYLGGRTYFISCLQFTKLMFFGLVQQSSCGCAEEPLHTLLCFSFDFVTALTDCCPSEHHLSQCVLCEQNLLVLLSLSDLCVDDGAVEAVE